MPAGRGNLCEACYWSKTCQARIQMDQAAFATPAMQSTFGEFGAWLEAQVGPNKAAITIHRYLPFFLAIEAEWQHTPTYMELLGHFTAEGLRRVRLPMQWFCIARGIEVDPLEREDDSERRRIQMLVSAFPNESQAGQMIVDYHNKLMEKQKSEQTALRSIRLALRPAVSLLLATDAQKPQLPDQPMLDRYLLDSPGQKAAITGFIHYLRAFHGLDLVIRTDTKKIQAAKRRKLEQAIIHMSQHPEEGNEFLWRWVSTGLEYFHKVKANKQTVRSATIATGSAGLRVAVNGQSYFLPRWDTA